MEILVKMGSVEVVRSLHMLDQESASHQQLKNEAPDNGQAIPLGVALFVTKEITEGCGCTWRTFACGEVFQKVG